MVELLVVIGIIAIIAAILFPVFARAKLAARGTACLGNLKQIGTAATLYMADYDDLFPNMVDASDKAHPEQWNAFPDFKAEIPDIPLMQDALKPYAKSVEIFHCPADTGSTVLDNNFPLKFEGSPSDYATFGSSYLYRTEISVRGETQTNMSDPTQINYLFDGSGHWHGGSAAAALNDDLQTYLNKTRNFRYTTLFADMHAKSLNYDQEQKAWSTTL